MIEIDSFYEDSLFGLLILCQSLLFNILILPALYDLGRT